MCDFLQSNRTNRTGIPKKCRGLKETAALLSIRFSSPGQTAIAPTAVVTPPVVVVTIALETLTISLNERITEHLFSLSSVRE
jgi:hypothetical protein